MARSATIIDPEPMVPKPDPNVIKTIERWVLATHGRPKQFHHADVRFLWGDNWRVNVYIEEPTDSIVAKLTMVASYAIRKIGADITIHQ